jgi:hypothetical protein
MRSLAALLFVVTFGLTLALMTDHNTSFCNTFRTNIGFVLCRMEHGPLASFEP